jgi:cyclophilin family peptidyl-prolyl cis-trans isomerase
MPVQVRRRKLLAMFPIAVAALGLSAACSSQGAGSAPKSANEQQAPAKPAADTKPTAAASPAAPAAAASKPAAKSMAGPPPMQIDQNKKYTAVIKTSMGEMTAELFAKDAPNTVNNFVFLSKEGFYNGVIFHRIIKEFMVQTGDPQGTGMGGPGYRFNDELTGPQTYQKGTLAMANAGPNTQGSQFFICHGSRAETLPGKVTAGLDVLDKIAGVPVKPSANGENSAPVEPPKIDTIQISEA